MKAYLVVSSILLAVSPWPASAVVIDDFSAGPLTLYAVNGHGGRHNVTQDIGGAGVLGGARHIDDFWARGSNDSSGPNAVLEVDYATNSLRLRNDTYAYFGMRYGSLEDPLNFDATADGNDRFRFVFSELVGGTPQIAPYLRLKVTTPSGHSRVSLDIRNPAGVSHGVVEVPFDAMWGSADFTNISQIQLGGGRIEPGSSFALEKIETAGPPIPGDYDRDGVVHVEDYQEWLRTFGSATYGGVLLGADGNGNGLVDRDDYAVWRDNLGRSDLLSGPSSAPEPSGLALVALAACWRRGAARRRR